MSSFSTHLRLLACARKTQTYARRHWLALGSICGLIAVLILAYGLSIVRAKSEQTAVTKLARLSEAPSVRAAGRGNPSIHLRDGRDLLTAYTGRNDLALILEQDRAQPLSMASADFDEDGVADLISGYQANGEGIVTLLRGNADSIYPNAPAAQQRKAQGTFTDAPFLSPAYVFATPVAPDFIGAGDFDGDGHVDVVVASRTRDLLFLLSGDGKGNLFLTSEIELPGTVTALATGEVNRPDGLTDLALGIKLAEGASLMVFEGPEGALRSAPEILPAPGTVRSLALTQMAGDQSGDLLVGAENNLMLVLGRDRKLSLNQAQRNTVGPPLIETRTLNSGVRSLAVGNFTGGVEPDIAVLSETGEVTYIQRPSASARNGKPFAAWTAETLTSVRWQNARQIVSAHLSADPTDDLVGIDSTNELRVLTRSRAADSTTATPQFDPKAKTREFSLGADRAVAGAMSFKLNSDTVDDLVVMRAGESAPSIVLSTPSAIITVNSAADTNARDNVITLREAILLSNGELLKSSLTPAEASQVNGTPAPGLDEVRFDIPAAAPATDFSANQPPKQDDPEKRAGLVRSLGDRPLAFEINEGQHDSRVKFLARGSGYSLFLTGDEAVLSLRSRSSKSPAGKSASALQPSASLRRSEPRQDVVRLKFRESNREARVTGAQELPGRMNYFIGNDPTKWRSDIKTYAKVKYEQVYPGVDVVYYGNQGQLEYDFVVAPGADPNAIKLNYEGVRHKWIDSAGNLVLSTSGGRIIQHQPIVYQETADARREIQGRYRLNGGDVQFQVDDYDRTQPLVIDPVLRYSTYWGGSNGDEGFAIASDGSNNVYLTGSTDSTDFPVRDAIQPKTGLTNVFVSKFFASGNNAPTLIFSTFVNGSATNPPGGATSSVASGIAIDGSGNVYVGGRTSCSNFPTVNPFQANYAGGTFDAFVFKLNTAGSALLFSTYLGGSGDDVVNAIAVDSGGNAHAAGNTTSGNFPIANAFSGTYGSGIDGFVAKLNPSGSALVYSTYLGGESRDEVQGLAVDSSGNAVATGFTSSPSFPIFNAIQPVRKTQDAFVTKLNPSGSAVFSTFLGGTNNDIGWGVAVDSAGDIYLTGQAGAGDFPGLQTTSFQPFGKGDYDSFVLKLSSAGSTILYSTYLGGSGNFDVGRAIAVDSQGNAYVTGGTDSSDFPILNAHQLIKRGPPGPPSGSTQQSEPFDAFVVKLNPTGSSLLYSTYLGGDNFDLSFGITVDPSGEASVIGDTFSSNFPTSRALQPTHAGGIADAFVAKFGNFNTGADLALSKTHTGNFTVGLTGVYNFTVTNGGTAASNGTITVTDVLPAGLEFVSGTGVGWTCDAVGQTVTCTNNNSLAANTSSSFALVVNVGFAAVPRVVNTASVANASDTALTNNQAMDTTGVIVDCVNPRPIAVGQTVNWALTSQTCRSPIRGPQTYADRFSFNGTAGQGVAITMTGGTVHPFLYLLGPNNPNAILQADGDGDNFSRIPSTNGFFSLPATGQYVIEATSVGFNETGAYTLSLTSGTAGCSYSIAPTSQSFATAGGTSTVAVTALAGCEWMAVSNASFISINSPSGTQNGNGVVTYTVSPNNSGGIRTGTMTIAGQTFTVTQNFGCSFTISPTNQNFGNAGGVGGITVTADNGCAWTAVSNDSFLHITTGGTGTGNGSPAYSVDANNTGNARTGTITVAGQTFTVIQSATSAEVRTITLTSPLPRITDPITIDGTTQPGFVGAPIIEINGVNLRNNGGGNGLDITAGSSTIRSLILNRFSSNNRDSAILLITNGNNVIEGCYLGPNSSGTQAFAPSGADALSNGVSMRSSSNNRIGGAVAAARNIISGIDGNGVSISGGSTANLVQGNYIGTDVTGSATLGFQRIGVFIQNASGNTIGGETGTPGAPPGNVISGNIDFGILILDDSHNNLVLGNLIGSNGTGMTAVPNKNAGVFIYNPAEVGGQLNNNIGGTTTGARNVISGNNPYGVTLGVGATSTQVQGNFIGTKISGAAALPNTYGITATQATGSTIGGAIVAARNVISGNNLNGVSIGFLNNGKLGGTGTTIQNNFIGTNFNATGPIPNQADGVFVEVQSITHTVQDNTIAFNGNNAVRIPNVTANPGTPGVRIQVVDNLIYANANLGIDLGDPGVTANTADGLPRVGEANLHQNFPVLNSFNAAAPRNDGKSAELGSDALSINGTLKSTPSTNFTVHWYFSSDSQCAANQQTSRPLVNGKVPNVVTNSSGNADFSISFDLPAGITTGIVNCTATDPQGNTSEFSACFSVNAGGVQPPAVRFESSTYTVNENAGRKTVSVVRTGDASAAASVDYATSDTALATGCNVVNTGSGSSRCDYQMTLGKLLFGAGETSKTISIPIIDDSYAEGNESFTVTLSNPAGAAISSPSATTVAIIDNDSANGANPIGDATFFTRMHYFDFLNREADTAGLNFWRDQITSCGSDAGCTEVRRINVSASFFLSIEFRQTGYLVERTYKASFGDIDKNSNFPQPTHTIKVPIIRFTEFLADTQQITQGVVVLAPGWEQQLENNKVAFFNEFVQRSRFTTALPTTMTPTQFVDALNTNAGNVLSASEKTTAINLFGGAGNTSNTSARAQALRQVAEDADLNTAEFNRAFVLMQYFGYLRRNPDDPQDTDYSGYEFWLIKLNQFGGNYINAEMVKAFLSSIEYNQRFGP